jgi:hypothetical protein
MSAPSTAFGRPVAASKLINRSVRSFLFSSLHSTQPIKFPLSTIPLHGKSALRSATPRNIPVPLPSLLYSDAWSDNRTIQITRSSPGGLPVMGKKCFYEGPEAIGQQANAICSIPLPIRNCETPPYINKRLVVKFKPSSEGSQACVGSAAGVLNRCTPLVLVPLSNKACYFSTGKSWPLNWDRSLGCLHFLATPQRRARTLASFRSPSTTVLDLSH